MDTTATIDTTTKITPDPKVPATSAAATPAVTTTSSSTSTAAAASTGSKFESFLKAQLAGKTAGNVSEEELFSALVGQRIEAVKDSQTAAKYSTALADNEKSMAKADGFVPCEDAAKKSLAGLRDSGVLTKDEADKIYSEAFAGAQLDSNKEALYDSRGGKGDKTVAIAEFTKALTSSKDVMDQIAAGTLKVTARSLDESSNGKTAGAATGAAATTSTAKSAAEILSGGSIFSPTGTKFDGAGGFLFKPVANSNKSLAVILPEAFKGTVSGVTVLDSLGKVLGSGTSTGFGDDGKQEKFSFNKSGGDYGKDLMVNVSFMDGTHAEYKIPDGSQRYD